MPAKSDPVWILFRRRTFSRLAYWLKVLGFDLGDRSGNNLFYLVYFCGFWVAWGVAVFAILGASLTKIFVFLPGLSPNTLVIQYSAIFFFAWGLIKFWQVVQRSPFVFSEPDAYLLCQAPVDRWKVGLGWFLMDWFGTGSVFAAGSIILSFSLTYDGLSGASTIQDLPAYFASSLRSLAIVLPLQMGVQAGLYGIGAWRLRRDRQPKKLIWLRTTLMLVGLGIMAAQFFSSWGNIFLSPITFPLEAAFGSLASPTDWFFGAGLSLLYLILGIVILVWGTSRMHLGLAAEETRLASVIRQAITMMNFELAETLNRRSKMGATHLSSNLFKNRGIWALIWKDLIQSWRSMRASQVVRWIYIFFLSIGVFLLSDWAAQLILGGIWMVVMGSLATERLRDSLANWWILRSLPFSRSTMLLALLGPASASGVILGWLAAALAGPLTTSDWLAAALLPFLVACAVLGTTRDILSHTKARVLLEPSIASENVPRQDIQGVGITLISIGLPLGLLTWSSGQPGGFVLGILSLLIAVLFTFLLFRSALSQFYRIS